MTLIERWFEEVWNQGRESAIDELAHPDAVVHGLAGHGQGAMAEDIAAFKALHRSFCGALSDIHIEVQQVIQQGDLTAAQCVVTGTHTGEGLGKAPKGKPLQFTGMCMGREKDGKLIEAWNQFDFNTMFDQME